MKLLIAIATYKRLEKLKRLINSLKAQIYQNFEIVVVCDNNDLDTAQKIKDLYPEIIVDVQPKHCYVIGAWNLVARDYFGTIMAPDGFIGLCDDVELKTDTLQNAVNLHKDRFADGDGVVGFNQECPGHPEYTFKWFGQTLMGRKFVERYKSVSYQICCPDYKHFFQDAEMYEYAISHDKFYNCKQAILYHYHPSFCGGKDEAHNTIRSGQYSPKDHDFKKRKMRLDAGYCWGKDFKLIGEI